MLDNGTDGQTDRRTDRRTDRVRRNMRPPPREEGRIINNWESIGLCILNLVFYLRLVSELFDESISSTIFTSIL